MPLIQPRALRLLLIGHVGHGEKWRGTSLCGADEPVEVRAQLAQLLMLAAPLPVSVGWLPCVILAERLLPLAELRSHLCTLRLHLQQLLRAPLRLLLSSCARCQRAPLLSISLLEQARSGGGRLGLKTDCRKVWVFRLFVGGAPGLAGR